MPLNSMTRLLRDRASGHAVYVLDPPEDRCAYLRGEGFGILRTVPAYHREHPHCAYLFGSGEGEEGQRRVQTLVLPTGSLKRTQILHEGRWRNETEYCFRPHHWAKLGLHLTDLTAVAEHYPAQAARAALDPGDLLAVRLPPTPPEMLLREFVSPEFMERTWKEDPAPVKKALRQTEPFFREALAACEAADCDLYLRDERDAPAVPEACASAVKDEYRSLRASERPVLVLKDGAAPGDPKDREACVFLGRGWKDRLTEWKAEMAADPEPVYVIPWEPDSLTELAALCPQDEASCGEAGGSVQ